MQSWNSEKDVFKFPFHDFVLYLYYVNMFVSYLSVCT